MIKKTIISSMIFLSVSTVTFAKSTSYVGGSLSAGGYSQVGGMQGVGASVFGGKGWYDANEKLYLGTELGANVTHHSKSYNSVGVGASLLPGVMLTKSTMLYGRVGLVGDYANVKSPVQDSYTFSTQVGLGLQTNVTKKWDMRAEYATFGYNRSNQVSLGLVYKLD